MELIQSVGMNTQTGTVYVYLKSTPFKRKVLYQGNPNWFVKDQGNKVIFTNETDVSRIKKFLD